jgi:hypothetical protein
MPKRGHTRAHARQYEPVVCRARHRDRRLQDQVHEAEQKQREAWRGRDRAPCRRALQHAAKVQLMIKEQAEAVRR